MNQLPIVICMVEIEVGPSQNKSSSASTWGASNSDAEVSGSTDETSVGSSSVTIKTLLEVCRISNHLDPEISAEWMMRRVQFFAYELQASLVPILNVSPLDDSQKLAHLNQYFFNAKQFRCATDKELNHLRLSRVLQTRVGTPMMLELLYAYFAEKIGICLQFVDLRPICLLKWRNGRQTRYIDISRGGALLSSSELIETLQSRFSFNNSSSSTFQANQNEKLLEDCSEELFTTEYVTHIKNMIDQLGDLRGRSETALFLQNALISYQPDDVRLVGERALIHRRLGNFKSALSDLKRYFAFHDRKRSSPELIRVHDELMQLLEGREL
jgi:regulator of sirC expression with transglutaminase-like and TPR domain